MEPERSREAIRHNLLVARAGKLGCTEGGSVRMGTPTLEEILAEHGDEIIGRFVSEVKRKELPPPGLSHSVLVNHIPAFLEEIARELRGDEPVRMSQEIDDKSPIARLHGGQRWSVGYELDAVIREYGVVRHCIMETAKRVQAKISIDEFEVVSKCLSVGVAEAATAYAKYRDDQLRTQKAEVEFLARAGQLLSSSLDRRSTLTRLTRLIVPALADFCAVHLDGGTPEDMPILHVDPDKGELVRQVYRRVANAHEFHENDWAALRTEEPRLVESSGAAQWEAVARSPDHLELLRRIDVRSWMIVPLRVQNSMLGSITFAFGDSGRAYGPSSLVLAEDLTRRAAVALDNARLYELSQDARIRVEAATRAKDEFVAMISHELRTPLNAILGWLQLENLGGLTDEKRQRAREVIERNAHALNQLVGDLLDISRAITGSIRINPSQLDWSNVIDLAIEGARPALEAKRITLFTDIERENSMIRGDGDRLQQVVWNLLTNAVKFTPKGGKIWVSLVRLESDFELTVEDSGAGIDAEFLPHVFESFRQSDSGATRTQGGLGIGLSIAQHIVQLHGGTVEAFSEGLGRGAKFTVRLPVSALVSATVGVPRVPAVDREKPALLRRLDGTLVLVVDDDDDARELLAVVLGSCGAEVTTVRAASDALSEIQKKKYSVVISDIGMPGTDGYSLIRGIRRLPPPERASVPAIALTAYARNEDRSRALLEGFNVHMIKPVEPAALVVAVADLIGLPADSDRS